MVSVEGTQKLFTLDNRLILRPAGRLSRDDRIAVQLALAKMLGIDAARSRI